MKRLITFICLIVIIIVGYFLIDKGFDNKSFPIASYNTIEAKHEALTTKLAGYDRINQDQYENAKSALESSIRTYKNSKTKYETILAELEDVLSEDSESEQSEQIQDVIYSDQEVYKIDFLLINLGNYARQEGVEVDMKLSSGNTTDSTASMLEYFEADMDFTATGPYINVANFIEYLEKDDRFGWEISNFSMTSGGNGVTASFTVKDIPIDSKSYIASKTSTENVTPNGTPTNPDGTENTNNVSDGNTVSNETVNPTNTVTNTTTNTVSDNTISNNTTN